MSAVVGIPRGGSSPPPDPPAVGTTIADIVAAENGIAELGVPVSTSTVTSIGMVRLGANVAQADNVVKDVSGFVRWFMLTAPVSASTTYPLIVATSLEPNTTVAFADGVVVSIVVSATASTAQFSTTQALSQGTSVNWRAGPIATQVYTWSSVTGTLIHPHFYVTRYFDGTNRTTAIVENGWVVESSAGPNNGIVYGVSLFAGAAGYAYTCVTHPSFSRYVRRFGTSLAHVNLVPHGWASGVTAGTFSYWKGSKYLPNVQTAYAMPTSVGFLHTSAPASPFVDEQYTADDPFSKTATWTGSNWVIKIDTTIVADAHGRGGNYNEGSIGGYSSQQGSPGDNPDIAVQPDYYFQGIMNFGNDGRRMITFHGDKRQELNVWYRFNSTKKFLRFDDGVTKKYVPFPAWAGSESPLIATVSAYVTANQMWEMAHWGAAFFLPYAITGDPVYFEGQMVQEITSWINAPFRVTGDTISTCYSTDPMERHQANLFWTDFVSIGLTGAVDGIDNGADSFLSFAQERAASWAARQTAYTLAVMPENDAKVSALGLMDKSTMRTYWHGVQNQLHKVFVSLNTGPTKRYRDGGVRYLQHQNAGYMVPYMQNFMWKSMGVANELGVLTTAGRDFTKWGIENLVNHCNGPINFEYMMDNIAWFTTEAFPLLSINTSNRSYYPVSAYLIGKANASTAATWAYPKVTMWSASIGPPQNPDYAGLVADCVVYGVDMAVSGAVSAYAFCTAVAQHWEGRDFQYSQKHDWKPR